MKVLLISSLCIFLLAISVGNAQQFSPTTGHSCYNCHPVNYSMSKSPSISNVWDPYGSSVDSWNLPGKLLPIPPSTYSQGLPSGQGKNSFVTLKTSSQGIYNDQLAIDVSGFVVGKTYKFSYAVLSASIHYQAGNNSPFGESATMNIFTVGQNPNLFIAEKITTFTNLTRNQWLTEEITFEALAPTLRFKLSGSTPGQSAGYVNFSIDKYPLECPLSSSQVNFTFPSSKYNVMFPSSTLDLSTVSINGGVPESAELVWKLGPNATDPSLSPEEASKVSVSNLDPANLKPYYAFFYAKDFNCYNVPVSQAELKFMHVSQQVPLKETNVAIACPDTTADLTLLEDNPAAQVRWYKNNTHSGLPVFDAKAAPPGDYYAFYYEFSAGTWSLKPGEVAAPKVSVVNAVAAGTPNLGPTLGINSLGFGPGAVRDFVVNIHNIAQQNSNCSVYFLVSKIPGYNIQYQTTAGQSDVDGGTANNNDKWTFSENAGFITVTSKTGMAAGEKSVIGFKISRNGGTTAGTTQTLNVIIPAAGGGGENVLDNNQVITAFTAN
ncbi:hypothetical protein [Dyadobacter fermentans]|nr:hypothetical protein [Dyadobacter fermentans]